jgi:diketogulonate reductase-like aldo/keto reductase
VRRPSLFAIPKTASTTHVEENAAADRVRLDDADLAAIDRAFPRGRARGLPTL